MQKKNILTGILMLSVYYFTLAQSYDKNYKKNLKYRLLVSYISETRDLTTWLELNKKIDPAGKEKARLRNSPNLLSGFMFQADNIAYYWAAALPQTTAEIEKYGRQKSFITKGSILIDALLINVNYVNQLGFYDQNYLNHPEIKGDTVSYRRHNNTKLVWTSVDLNYYPAQRQSCLGVPFYFGERQLKSKFFMGSRLAYNNIKLNSGQGSLFRDSVHAEDASLQFASLRYTGLSLAAVPSLYLVAKKKWFIFFDAALGVAVGATKTNVNQSFKPLLQLEIPQAKVASGINTDRFLLALYYTYLNQSFQSGNLKVGNVLGNFGFLIGLRINQWRYRHLNWETI